MAYDLDPERVDAIFYIGQHWRLAGHPPQAVKFLSDAVRRVFLCLECLLLSCVLVCCDARVPRDAAPRCLVFTHDARARCWRVCLRVEFFSGAGCRVFFVCRIRTVRIRIRECTAGVLEGNEWQ